MYAVIKRGYKETASRESHGLTFFHSRRYKKTVEPTLTEQQKLWILVTEASL